MAAKKQKKTLPAVEKNPLPTFEIIFENKFSIKGELYPGLAPNTVGSSIHLANSGFYDGAVITASSSGSYLMIDHPENKPPYCVDGEMPLNDCEYNKGKVCYGALCMHHPNGCYSVRSQFIVVLSSSQSSWKMMGADYAFFGQVLEGMRFASLMTEYKWNFTKDSRLEYAIASIRVDTHGKEYPFQTIPVPEGYP